MHIRNMLPALFLVACMDDPGAPDVPDVNSELVSAASVSSALVNGDVIAVSVQSSSKCLDVPNASKTSGTQLQQYTCNGSSAQKFRVRNNADGTTTLINKNSGMCVDVRSNSSANGAAIQQATCNGTSAQNFTLAAADAGMYRLVTTHQKCVDITGRSLANNALVQQWQCVNGTNQTFATATKTPAVRKSIQQWAHCDGTDQSVNVATAFAAAARDAFTLVVDCTVDVKIGRDIGRPIFIDNGTSVDFTSAGKFRLTNLWSPGFVIAGTQNVSLTNWNVEWDNSMAVDEHLDGYYDNGTFISRPGSNGTGVFNDNKLSPWLTTHRGIVFDQSKGRNYARWAGSVNTAALFLFRGDTANVTVAGMKVYAPASADASHFVPFVFMFALDYKNNQTVTYETPLTAQYYAVPHDLSFTNIDLDGTYMGFQGSMHDAVFDHVHSKRYADLQDAAGGNVGGIGKWFPPPHLFYINYGVTGDPALFNHDIAMRDITDDGVRLGIARDTGTNGTSGFACSLKLGCDNCSVDGYKSARPDGFMDVLASNGLSVSNVTATFSSRFINSVFPGWRFPQAPYANILFSNVTLTDTAATADKAPVGNCAVASNENLVFDNVSVHVNDWVGTSSLVPAVSNQGLDSSIAVTTTNGPTITIGATSRTVGLVLEANKTKLAAGGMTTLTWTTTNATSCTPSGAWSGTAATSGSKSVSVTTGAHSFTLTCKNGTDTTTATAVVTGS